MVTSVFVESVSVMSKRRKVVASCTGTRDVSSRPRRRTRVSPVDPTAGGSASSCSDAPIIHASPRAAALVSERRQQASSSEVAPLHDVAGCGMISYSNCPPSRPSVGLGIVQVIALTAAGMSHPKELSVASSYHRSWLRCSSWLRGGSSGPWHISSGLVAGETSGGAGDGRS